ncbi:hypothetical protein CEXT_126101 [Caerostris extrusa]|uniref:Uncharacterized protein n=1 Tax=Caerostris extrusa TaxID=172846 RepID=A0AAV4QWX3_CAEEX|nr:hypothetical protein CEXT_126101 [Caerostris extrusa]
MRLDLAINATDGDGPPPLSAPFGEGGGKGVKYFTFIRAICSDLRLLCFHLGLNLTPIGFTPITDSVLDAITHANMRVPRGTRVQKNSAFVYLNHRPSTANYSEISILMRLDLAINGDRLPPTATTLRH